MYALILLEEAIKEWREASHYYELQRKGLGNRFSVVLEERLILIQHSPKLFQKIKKEFRKATISPFPLELYFESINYKYYSNIFNFSYEKEA